MGRSATATDLSGHAHHALYYPAHHALYYLSLSTPMHSTPLSTAPPRPCSPFPSSQTLRECGVFATNSGWHRSACCTGALPCPLPPPKHIHLWVWNGLWDHSVCPILPSETSLKASQSRLWSAQGGLFLVTVHRQAPIGLAAGPHAPLQGSLAIGSSQGREPL